MDPTTQAPLAVLDGSFPYLPMAMWETIFHHCWNEDPNWDPDWRCLWYYMGYHEPLNDVCEDHARLHANLQLIRRWQQFVWEDLTIYVEVDAWEEHRFRCWYTGNLIEWNSCRRVSHLVQALQGVHKHEVCINVAAPADEEGDWLEWAWFISFCYGLADEVVIKEWVEVSYSDVLIG